LGRKRNLLLRCRWCSGSGYYGLWRPPSLNAVFVSGSCRENFGKVFESRPRSNLIIVSHHDYRSPCSTNLAKYLS
jgi:hypothetical protein